MRTWATSTAAFMANTDCFTISEYLCTYDLPGIFVAIVRESWDKAARQLYFSKNKLGGDSAQIELYLPCTQPQLGEPTVSYLSFMRASGTKGVPVSFHPLPGLSTLPFTPLFAHRDLIL